MIKIFLSLLIILSIFLILLIMAIVIFLDDGFPIIFQQERSGLNAQCFLLYKFRTMKSGTPNIATHLLNDNKSFLIKSGKLLRKLSLDELPQLFNIIKGDMVFIGPRPALFNQNDLIKMRIDNGIHKILPGITGWAQVNGRDKLSLEEKVRHDKYYMNNRSVILNFKILILTFWKVMKSDDIS